MRPACVEKLASIILGNIDIGSQKLWHGLCMIFIKALVSVHAMHAVAGVQLEATIYVSDQQINICQ